MSKNLQKTPLHGFHERHGARFVEFGGWDMPVQFTGIIEEHQAVRERVGLFDVSHMGEALIHGPDAESFLNHVLTNDISALSDNQVLYTIMCQDDGGCVDDLLVYRYSDAQYLLCLNASNTPKDMQWLQERVGDFNCHAVDVSTQYAQLALQGPRSMDVLGHLVEHLPKLERFHFIETKISGIETIISRTGYTGEDGFELYCPAQKGEFLAETLMGVGEEHEIQLCGLGARDSLRLEAGYSLYGHEISETISPLQANLNFAVKLKKKNDFMGKTALLKQKEEGLASTVKFFKLDGKRIARQGFKVFEDGQQVGEVLSGTYSPTLDLPIGSILVDFNSGESLEVDIRGKRIPLLLVKPPFI